jgi:D-3-phosphoglycerate dehydrogenase
MTDFVVENLILDLLEWVAKQERSYSDTMEAWRTSCPKLPVWEDATDRGLIELDAKLVRLTPAGRAFLRQHRITFGADRH